MRPTTLPQTAELNAAKALADRTVQEFNACDLTLTPTEKNALQHYALASQSRTLGLRPTVNPLMDAVIYYWQELMRPAPQSTKDQITRQLAQAISAWRTA